MTTNNYPNLTENEIDWLVLSAAQRTDVNVKDLINSFFAIFPDRATHEGMSGKMIRNILTSRFNDILYRKDRGYSQIIVEKRAAFQEVWKLMEDPGALESTFSVLNAMSLLHFHEQVFTDPKAKSSDKFKAIDAAETLRVRIERSQREASRKKPAARQEERKTIWHDDEIDFLNTIYNIQEKYVEQVLKQLPEALRQEIQEKIDSNRFNTPAENALYLLKEKGMSEALEKVDSILSDPRPREIGNRLSFTGLQKFTKKFSKNKLKQMSIDELDTLLDIYMDALL